MGRPRREPLIGRTRELSELRRALSEAQAGRGSLVLIAGEPGIGKSRLALELATMAQALGLPSYWGRCFERSAAPAFWPWTQVVRGVTSSATDECVRHDDSRDAAHVHPLLVPHGRPIGGLRATAPHPAATRFQIFEAVRIALERACAASPLAVILEDLHWADRNSLLLLEFLARQLRELPLLLAATYRDTEAPERLSQTVGELARLGALRLGLHGMTPHETARLMRVVSGCAVPDCTLRVVHARTSGNPFFVREIARLPASGVRGVPQNARDAISWRLAPLSTRAKRMLALAAAMGREFDLQVVAAALGESRDDRLLDALDEALRAGIVEPLPRRGEDSYQFRHELIRDVLYESASPSRRARWHADLLAALEKSGASAPGEHATELAAHAVWAQRLVGSATVVKYSRIAGEQRLAGSAYEEALPHFERAWAACRAAPVDAASAAILLGLGFAQAATAVRWNRQEGWATLRRAIDYYLAAGEVGRAVAAAVHPAIAAEGVSGVVTVLEQIRAAAPAGSLDEGWLLARLGAAVYFKTGDYRGARVAFDRAHAIAASHREPALELRTLAYETAVDHFDLRWSEALAKSRRVVALARRTHDLYSEAYARYRAAFVLTHTGQVDEATLEVERNLAAAERLRDRGLLADALYIASTLAQLTGAWREARAHSDRGLALASGHLPLLHGRVLLEYETGHEKQGAAYLKQLQVADAPEGPYPLAGVFTAIALAQTARLERATRESEAGLLAIRRVLRRSSAIPNAVVTVRMSRALWCVAHRDADGAEVELEFLGPFRTVVPVQWGLTTARLLGLLACTLRQPRRAAALFENAVTYCRQSGYRPELAWTCCSYAPVLLENGSRDDRLRAAALLDEAGAIAAALAMPRLAARLDAIRNRYRLMLDKKPCGLTNRELEVLQLVASGRSNKEIAQTLLISVNTVAVHVARLLEKTGASNRTEAAARAARQHLLSR